MEFERDYENEYEDEYEEEKPRGEIKEKQGGIEIRGSVMSLIDLKRCFERQGTIRTILLDSKKDENVDVEIRTLWPSVFISIEQYTIEIKERDFFAMLEKVDRAVISKKKNAWDVEYIIFISNNTLNLSIPELSIYETLQILSESKEVK